MASAPTTSRSRSSAPVTIRQVAARAGVSTATVSRVLGGLEGAGREVRERVLAAADTLRYRPNRLARSLRGGRRRMIGVIIPDIQNPFFTGVVHGIEAALCRHGYSFLLGHSDGLAERERMHLEVFRSEGAGGLVLAPANAPEADYRAFASGEVPIVALDRSPAGLEADLVTTNNREAARGATAHLLSAGHPSIALINGPECFDVSRERLAGYLDALRAAGLAPAEAFILHGDFREGGGREAMSRLLALPHRPRAVFAANILMAVGALGAILAAGLRVPEDVALVGFDDTPWAALLRPALTTVAQPAVEMGRTAAELLLQRLEDPSRPTRHVLLGSCLVVRESCGAAAAPPGPAIPSSPQPP